MSLSVRSSKHAKHQENPERIRFFLHRQPLFDNKPPKIIMIRPVTDSTRSDSPFKTRECILQTAVALKKLVALNCTEVNDFVQKCVDDFKQVADNYVWEISDNEIREIQEIVAKSSG